MELKKIVVCLTTSSLRAEVTKLKEGDDNNCSRNRKENFLCWLVY